MQRSTTTEATFITTTAGQRAIRTVASFVAVALVGTTPWMASHNTLAQDAPATEPAPTDDAAVAKAAAEAAAAQAAAKAAAADLAEKAAKAAADGSSVAGGATNPVLTILVSKMSLALPSFLFAKNTPAVARTSPATSKIPLSTSSPMNLPYKKPRLCSTVSMA